MELCSANHGQVCFESRTCPVCDMREAERDLAAGEWEKLRLDDEKKRDSLKLEIKKLQEKLKEEIETGVRESATAACRGG